jgi:hypothetical protein
MKSNTKSQQLKLLTICSAAAATALRAAHYAFGTDGRGLLVVGHWSVIGLWAVTVGFILALLLLGCGIKNPAHGTELPSASPVSAVGCFALAAGLVITALQQFGESFLTADLLFWALGLLVAIGLLVAGICRLSGKKLYFLIHAALCLFFTLRMIIQYRNWSADPQLQDYGFYLCAHAAIMLASYHQAALDAGMGNLKALWISSLGAVYLCCAAMPRCDDALLMGCCALWALTNPAALPVRKRRIRPAFRTAEQGEE